MKSKPGLGEHGYEGPPISVAHTPWGTVQQPNPAPESGSVEAAEHTPTPWRHEPEVYNREEGMHSGYGSIVGGGDDWFIATIENAPEAPGNAAFIVIACNAHDALVARVAELEDQLLTEKGLVTIVRTERDTLRTQLAEANRYLLADEERRKLTGDAISAEAEASDLRTQNATLVDALGNCAAYLEGLGSTSIQVVVPRTLAKQARAALALGGEVMSASDSDGVGHTPTPWTTQGPGNLAAAGHVWATGERLIAGCNGSSDSRNPNHDEENHANAAHIVACVNGWDALTAELTRLRSVVEEQEAQLGHAKRVMSEDPSEPLSLTELAECVVEHSIALTNERDALKTINEIISARVAELEADIRDRAVNSKANADVLIEAWQKGDCLLEENDTLRTERDAARARITDVETVCMEREDEITTLTEERDALREALEEAKRSCMEIVVNLVPQDCVPVDCCNGEKPWHRVALAINNILTKHAKGNAALVKALEEIKGMNNTGLMRTAARAALALASKGLLEEGESVKVLPSGRRVAVSIASKKIGKMSVYLDFDDAAMLFTLARVLHSGFEWV